MISRKIITWIESKPATTIGFLYLINVSLLLKAVPIDISTLENSDILVSLAMTLAWAVLGCCIEASIYLSLKTIYLEWKK